MDLVLLSEAKYKYVSETNSMSKFYNNIGMIKEVKWIQNGNKFGPGAQRKREQWSVKNKQTNKQTVKGQNTSVKTGGLSWLEVSNQSGNRQEEIDRKQLMHTPEG